MKDSQLISIIAHVLNQDSSELPAQMDAAEWKALLTLARRHSVGNYLYYVLPALPQEAKPEAAVQQQLKQHALAEAAKSSAQLHAAQELIDAFEAAGIDAMLLKGAVTKTRYPRDDLRTMGDVDVLFKPQQQRLVRRVLEKLGYEDFREGQKHDHYSRKPFLSLEMHRQPVAADSEFAAYYGNIWQRSRKKPGYTHIYALTAEDEMLFNFVHLTEHFKEGGIGIRMVMDVYVYSRLPGLDWAYIASELKNMGMDAFYENIHTIAQAWFGKGQLHTQVQETLCEYILASGAFGARENIAALAVGKQGKGRFLLQACFPGRKQMISMYPWLEKWPVLLPVAWVRRGVGGLLHRRQNIRVQYQKLTTGDEQLGKRLQDFYRQCGL